MCQPNTNPKARIHSFSRTRSLFIPLSGWLEGFIWYTGPYSGNLMNRILQDIVPFCIIKIIYNCSFIRYKICVFIVLLVDRIWLTSSGISNPDYWWNIQLTVHCWFGARWFGILGIPSSNNPFRKGIPKQSKPAGPKPTTNQFVEDYFHLSFLPSPLAGLAYYTGVVFEGAWAVFKDCLC